MWVKIAWWGSRFWVEDQLLKLSPEARRLKKVDESYRALINKETTIDEIAIRNGCFSVKATSEAFHFLCRQVVEYMNSLGAKNFLEQECEFRIWSGPVKLIVTVQKAEGKSPATLKAEAEERARVAEAQIAKIHELLANAQSYSHGELLSEIALIVDWARPVETSQKYDPSVIITLPDKAEVARQLCKVIEDSNAEAKASTAKAVDNFIAMQTNEQI